jgi:hypothetical protein
MILEVFAGGNRIAHAGEFRKEGPLPPQRTKGRMRFFSLESYRSGFNASNKPLMHLVISTSNYAPERISRKIEKRGA